MALRIPRSRRARQRWLEVAVAAVISIAGLATSWSAYQAALWNGVQTIHFGRANAARVLATRAALKGATVQLWTASLLTAWLEAKARGDERLAAFYQARFPPDFQPAFAEWMAQRPLENAAAAASPFRLPSYEDAGLRQAEALDARAEKEFTAGQAANRTSDAFTRGAVILATAMFFGGILQVFRGMGPRAALGLVAVIACLWGLERIFSLPILTLAPP